MNNLFILMLCALGGVVTHTLLKYQGLATDAQKANTHLSFAAFLRNDFMGVILSILAACVWLAVYGEVMEKYPGLKSFTRLTFFAVGGLGSYLLQLIFSRAKKKIRQVVDEKTNIADGVAG